MRGALTVPSIPVVTPTPLSRWAERSIGTVGEASLQKRDVITERNKDVPPMKRARTISLEAASVTTDTDRSSHSEDESSESDRSASPAPDKESYCLDQLLEAADGDAAFFITADIDLFGDLAEGDVEGLGLLEGT